MRIKKLTTSDLAWHRGGPRASKLSGCVIVRRRIYIHPDRAELIILNLPIILFQISTYFSLLFYNILPVIPAYLTHFSLIKKSITHAEKCVYVRILSVRYESNSQ